MNNFETEDKISLLVIVCCILLTMWVIFDAWSNPNNALQYVFKSTFNQIKCESMDGDGAKCAAYQRQTGKCAWYGACNKCSKTGQLEAQLCAQNKIEKTTTESKNETKNSPDQSQNINCSQYNDQAESCIESQKNGSKCSWYSGCKLCVREGTYSDADFLRMCQEKAKSEK